MPTPGSEMICVPFPRLIQITAYSYAHLRKLLHHFGSDPAERPQTAESLHSACGTVYVCATPTSLPRENPQEKLHRFPQGPWKIVRHRGLRSARSDVPLCSPHVSLVVVELAINLYPFLPKPASIEIM
jgi:hypothetical protein